MNRDIIEGNWKQLKGKVKQQWGKLTDDAVDKINGDRELLAGKIQEAYGVDRDEAKKQIEAWAKACEKFLSKEPHH
ncbi:MAG: CsbD family protein [Burkholderiaceae bacterium]|nr:MAG: CsbD family protein [Burkholderiaceae bacterium]